MLEFGNRSWGWPAAACVAVAIALLWWGYRRATGRTSLRMSLGGLKLLAFLLLALSLTEPLWSSVRATPGENLLLLLCDLSQSLSLRDEGQEQSRGEEIAARLTEPESRWQARLEQEFLVRRYQFSSQTQAVPQFNNLKFNGSRSTLYDALRTLRERHGQQPLAGVMVFTDGLATDAKPAPEELDALPPIYPVLPPRRDAQPDLAVEQLTVTQTSFEDAPVTLLAEVACRGYEPETLIVAELRDEEGTVIETQTQPAGERNPLAFRFHYRPVRQGVLFHELRVFAQGEQAAFEQPELSREATLKNNVRLAKVERGAKPLRILYLAGRPNWEFKFLNRALADDPQMQLVGLIRIASREAKFDWRGDAGKSKNALFRGFENDAEEAVEQYDEPVLLRVNTRTPEELRGGFPKTAKELFQYDALAIDDMEAEFFTQDQQELIQEFVSRRGGGLLMLGGPLSYREGRYNRSVIGGLLPVKLDEPPTTEPGQNYRLSLSRDGWLQPWLRLRTTRPEETDRLAELPPFQIINRVPGIKPGASVLASATDQAGREFPALGTQRYGRGRTGALLIGDLWRAQLMQPETESGATKREDFGKAWRQMFRWLVADVPEPVEIQLESQPDAAAIQLKVRARDEQFKPLENARVELTVQRPGDLPPVTLPAEASLEEPGVFVASFLPRESGGFRVTANVTTLEGVAVGQAVGGWVEEPEVRELQRIEPNRAALEELAARTGGRVLELDELEEFAETLPTKNVPITEFHSAPLWHQPWFFLLALGCLAGEWGLRRWKGLP